MERRTLTDEENRKLRSYCLPPHVEDAVRRVWSQREYKKKGGFLGLMIGNFLLPLLTIVAGLNLFAPDLHPQIPMVFNLVRFITIAFFVVLLPLIAMIMMLPYVFTREYDERIHPLDHFGMANHKKSTKIRKVYGRLLFMTFILFMIMNGHVWLSFWAVVAYFVGTGCFYAIKSKTAAMLAAIEKQRPGYTAADYEVLPD